MSQVPETVRSALFAYLREAGLTTIFGNPGSTELPMYRDFPDDFRYVLALQESIAVGMADGYAQATGRAALVNLHSAAGVGHALGNIFTAFKNQTPLVITAGQQARSMLPFDPFLYAERSSEFPRPYVKWAIEPSRAEDVPLAIARAHRIAMEAPRGPTFVSIPVDDWDQPGELIAARTITASNPGDAAALAALGRRLGEARHPALVVGAGAARDDAWWESIALAEAHDMRVFAAPFSARCSFPEDHPLFGGFLPAFRSGIVGALDGHDLIVAAGGPLSLYHAEEDGPHLPDGAELVLISDNIAHAAAAPVGDAIIANVKQAFAALLGGPARRARTWQPAAPQAPGPGGRFDDAYLFSRIHCLRPADSIVVEEAPSSKDALHAQLPITVPAGYFTCASGGLGHGLPASVGVALGAPDRKTIAILGDGSSLYSIQGLWNARQLSLPMSFVIVNNGRYEALEGFGRRFGLEKPVGTRLPDLDFVKIADAQGVMARRVSDAAALDEALRWSLAARVPTLLNVVVEG